MTTDGVVVGAGHHAVAEGDNGRTPGCEGCISLVRGKPFQQVRRNEECRSRIFKKKADEEEKEEQVRKKAREEDLREDRQRAAKRAAEVEIDERQQEQQQRSRRAQAEGPAGVRSPKRKGGERGTFRISCKKPKKKRLARQGFG